MVVWYSVKFYFSVSSVRNILGALLNVFTWMNLLVLDMVLYSCIIVLSTPVVVFGDFFTYGISCVCAFGISFWLCLFTFSAFSLFLVAFAKNLLGWVFNWLLFWVQLLEFLWMLLLENRPRKFCMGDWTIELVWFVYLVFFLVHLLEFLWVCLLQCHLWRYLWVGCFYKYIY